MTLSCIVCSLLFTNLGRRAVQCVRPLPAGVYELHFSRRTLSAGKSSCDAHSQTIEACGTEPFTLFVLRAPLWLGVYSGCGFSSLKEVIEATDWEEVGQFTSEPQSFGCPQVIRLRTSLAGKMLRFEQLNGDRRKLIVELPKGKKAMKAYATGSRQRRLGDLHCVVKYAAQDGIPKDGIPRDRVTFMIVAVPKGESVKVKGVRRQ